MSKAILVIDIPQHLLNSDKYYAEVRIKPQDRRRDWYEKAVEAELKHLPEKLPMSLFAKINEEYTRGRNDCIDEILGDKDE